MTDDEQPASDPPEVTCRFCLGGGLTPRAWAYAAGPDPFLAPAETVLRSGQCKHCLGTGAYDADLDPSLDDYRDPGPDPHA
ncbi:hypothetical protein WDH52_17285 [Streptomyces sp. TRM70308]|uniref:hypothetical protein n=1 Tax=Streptomyces sp. TRM70308 TaxID=3131932 RepID=UPI003D028F47